MKRLSVVLLVFGAVLSMFAQDISMRNILEISAPIVQYLEVDNDQEIVRMEFDIVASEPKYTFRTLYAGYTYGICAFGDYRIADLDIKVYKSVDDELLLLRKDEDSSDVATVIVEPSVTGEYVIEISAYEFVEGYSVGHYGLVIFHE